MPRLAAASLFLLAPALALAANCPSVHVFGARETTAPAGYGTAGSVVTSIVNSYSGATSEAINYPACGGQSSCGGDSYAQSVQAGLSAVASQVNSYNSQCPNTVLVLVGYSQGGQIFDDAYCGGGDSNEGISNTASPLTAAALKKIAAAIFMGDPRHIPGLSYNVGSCEASGFAPRPTGFQCPYASNIQSYCDATDPYCCNGSDAATHQGYATEYGSVALAFVKNKVNAALGGSTTAPATSTAPGTSTAPATTSTSGGGSGCSTAMYGQCGGIGFTGCTTCAAGSTCKVSNSYYSQCL